MSSESWVYPLTDSSYDSLENELDDSSGGSPSFCSRAPFPPKPGSLESILTFSDYDQDTEADVLPREDAPSVDASPTLASLTLEDRRTRRRRSEPAVAYAAKLCPHLSGSTDGLTGEDEDAEEELSKRPSSHTVTRTHSRGRTRRGGAEPGSKDRSAALEASSSSLSSTPASPAPTRSSLDSLDSLGGERTTRRATKTQPPTPPAQMSPKDNTPKEALNWGPLKGCMVLHPNSWLRKDRRLSLTQQDSVEMEDEETGVSGSNYMAPNSAFCDCIGFARCRVPNTDPFCQHLCIQMEYIMLSD